MFSSNMMDTFQIELNNQKVDSILWKAGDRVQRDSE